MTPHTPRPLAGRTSNDVCVVIPVHNEVCTIGSVVLAARRHCERVLVVDDGSTDDSARAAELAGARVIRQGRRRGKGAALRKGLQTAFAGRVSAGGATRPNAALLMDGDGQHQPQEIPRFLALFGVGADFIVGDRSATWSAMPRTRLWTNRLMTCALRPFLHFGLHDSQCGFRLVSADLWARLSIESDHYEIESETLLAASRNGVRPVYVTVTTHYGGERSKIRPLVDSFRFLRLLARSLLHGDVALNQANSEPMGIGRAHG